MIEVQGSRALADAMRLAIETKTEDQLLKWLLWLDEWYDKNNVVVYIRPDLPTSPGSLMWYAHHIVDGVPQDECFYNGGLIFHRHANEWSIHS